MQNQIVFSQQTSFFHKFVKVLLYFIYNKAWKLQDTQCGNFIISIKPNNYLVVQNALGY